MKKRMVSAKISERMKRVIPGGVNSPVRRSDWVDGIPLIVERGQGDTIYDVDGNAYVDYCGSWGALLHGHSHPVIVYHVRKRMEKGSTFGISCEPEMFIAEKIVELLPAVEKVRFVCSGTEATMTAVRVARGYTGKDLIVKFAGNYHGHADSFLTQAGSGVMGLSASSSSAGIPPGAVSHTLTLEYNNCRQVREVFAHPEYGKRIAAVILEPIAGNMGVVPADFEFITALREETNKHAALLIFDEVITGFRIGLRGAQEYFGVVPDLSCFGKVIGGGYPVAAFGGRKEIMDTIAPLGPVYQAGTLAGNPVAMEAGYHALCLAEEQGFYEELERKAKILCEPIAEYLRTNEVDACLQRVGSMMTLFFGKREVRNRSDAMALDNETFKDLFCHLFRKGIYIPPMQQEAWFISSAHTEENLEMTRDAVLEFLMTRVRKPSYTMA